MKQHEAVINTLEKLGGIATLSELYEHVKNIKECKWETKTPNESIRRIVRTRKNEIYRIKPGLYGLLAFKERNERNGFISATKNNQNTEEFKQSNHTYYQGLLLQIGNLRGFETFAPQQDKNKMFSNKKKIDDLRSIKSIFDYGYPEIVQRSSTIDAIWFNVRKMPDSFFEVEYSPEFQNSLIKYSDLLDYNVRMVVVSDKSQKNNLDKKLNFNVFKEMKKRIVFWTYERCNLGT